MWKVKNNLSGFFLPPSLLRSPFLFFLIFISKRVKILTFCILFFNTSHNFINIVWIYKIIIFSNYILFHSHHCRTTFVICEQLWEKLWYTSTPFERFFSTKVSLRSEQTSMVCISFIDTTQYSFLGNG